jgi:hypothetical protein
MLLDQTRRLLGIVFPLQVMHRDPRDAAFSELDRDPSSNPS